MASILKNLKKFFSNTDKTLWLLTISATVYSIMLISSMQRSYEYNYLTSQMIAIIVGYIMVIVMTLIDYERLLNLWWLFGGISLTLLALVFVIGVNVAGTDDTAWINLPGGISFQPSEIVKIFFIVTFTKHLQTLKESEKLHTLFGVLSLIVHMAVPVAIIHFQGDDGTVLVFLFVFLIMAFVGGVQLRYFLIMLLLIAAGIPILWNYVLNDEHKNRMSAIFDIDGNAMTTYGWQQYQGKVSVASGGMSGTGLGNGARVASGIVPEQENDFILTVAGEELGFIGCVLLIGLLLLILVKIIINAVTARDYAGRMLCIGVFSMIAVQTIVNVGMVLGLLPVIGITLPFFSSGGTSMLSMLMGIGLVHSVHYHKNRIDKPVGILRGKRYQYLNTQY
jgi:rod shape determining protein RodA